MKQKPAAPARVLVLSLRDSMPSLSRCMTFEFEDIVSEVDAADLAPLAAASPLRQRLLTRLDRTLPGLAARAWPAKLPRREPYELLFVSMHAASHLRLMQPLGAYLDAARVSVCNIDEIWRSDLALRSGEIAMLRRFDHVFTACAGAVDAVQQATGRPCHYLPPSVDTLRFCPFPARRERTIDVYFMGRRRREPHQAILDACAATNRFYLYDTSGFTNVFDHREHRRRLADLIARTRYFVVDIAKADDARQISNQEEIGTRYFEAAAAGAVLVGFVPRTPVFAQLFGWPDSVVPLVPNADAVKSLLDELDGSPEHVETIRRENVLHSLRLHDGVYRWEQILDAVGLEPLPALYERKRRLLEHVKSIEGDAPSQLAAGR